MFLKKLFPALLAALSLPFFPQAHAQDYYSCSLSPCCDNNWAVYGDWIYWRTRRGDLDYAVPYLPGGPVTTFGNVQSVTPEWDNGFRVGFLKKCNNFFVDCFYTYYRTNATDITTSPDSALVGTRLNSLTATSPFRLVSAEGNWKLHYDVLDVLVGYEFCNSNCFETYAFGGFKFASITQKLESNYIRLLDGIPVQADVVQDHDIDAYGIDLGFGANYILCQNFNFFGKASYDFLAAHHKRSFITILADVTAADLNDNFWGTAGLFNLALGFGYSHLFSHCWCAKLNLSFGYEFHQWMNLVDFLDFRNNAGDVTIDRHLQSLGFDGLFLRLAVGF